MRQVAPDGGPGALAARDSGAGSRPRSRRGMSPCFQLQCKRLRSLTIAARQLLGLLSTFATGTAPRCSGHGRLFGDAGGPPAPVGGRHRRAGHQRPAQVAAGDPDGGAGRRGAPAAAAAAAGEPLRPDGQPAAGAHDRARRVATHLVGRPRAPGARCCGRSPTSCCCGGSSGTASRGRVAPCHGAEPARQGADCRPVRGAPSGARLSCTDGSHRLS